MAVNGRWPQRPTAEASAKAVERREHARPSHKGDLERSAAREIDEQQANQDGEHALARHPRRAQHHAEGDDHDTGRIAHDASGGPGPARRRVRLEVLLRKRQHDAKHEGEGACRQQNPDEHEPRNVLPLEPGRHAAEYSPRVDPPIDHQVSVDKFSRAGSTGRVDPMSIWRGMVAGLIGGAGAAAAMSLVHGVVGAIGAGAREQPAPDGQPLQEDSTVKVAEGIIGWLVHRPLPENKKPLASNLVHYAFGASVGAFYGGVAAMAPGVTIGAGLPFGATVWLGAHIVAVPALGLAEPPTRRPPAQEGLELVAHLVYGAVTELTRRLIRRAL